MVEHLASGRVHSLTKAPSMAKTMLLAMLIMTFAFWAYAVAVSLLRLRCIVREREQQAQWLNGTKE